MPTPPSDYCRFTETQIRQAGLLTPKRSAEVEAQTTARIEPCFDQHGNELPNAKVAVLRDGSRTVFSPIDSENSAEFLRRMVLSDVLTSDELAQINSSALKAIDEADDNQRFSVAQKLTSWSGGVFCGNHYFLSMEELFDHLEREGLPWPKFVWAAESQAVIPALAVQDVIGDYIDDRGWYDMDTNDLDGVSEFQEALDKFTEANAGAVSYLPDFSRTILVHEWRAAAETNPLLPCQQ